MRNRSILSTLALALALLLPATGLAPPAYAQADDSFTVQVPRAGDVAAYHYVYDSSRGYNSSGAARAFEWLGFAPASEDAFGALHRVYDVRLRPTWDGLPATRLSLDLDTRDVVRATRESAWETPGMSAGGLDVSIATGSTTRSVAVDLGPWSDQTHSLGGALLRVGEPVPHSAFGGWTVDGWQDVEGKLLFVISRDEVQEVGTSRNTVYEELAFTEGVPVPVRDHTFIESMNVATGATSTLTYTLRLTGWTPGTGAVLAAPTYEAPAPRTEREDARWSTYTRDGPDENILDSLPLPQAAARVRATPEMQAFLNDHDDVYLHTAWFREDGVAERVQWELTYAAGGASASLTATVAGTLLPGVPAPDARVERIHLDVSTLVRPTSDGLVGERVACTAEAEAALLRESPEMADAPAGLLRSGGILVGTSTSVPELRCTYHAHDATGHEGEPGARTLPYHTSRWGRVHLDSATGATQSVSVTRQEGWIRAETER